MENLLLVIRYSNCIEIMLISYICNVNKYTETKNSFNKQKRLLILISWFIFGLLTNTDINIAHLQTSFFHRKIHA